MLNYETRDDLKVQAKKILGKMHSDVRRAGVKREWNRFVGSIPSKNDVKRAAIADLESLNEICVYHGWDLLYRADENEEVKMPTVVD